MLPYGYKENVLMEESDSVRIMASSSSSTVGNSSNGTFSSNHAINNTSKGSTVNPRTTITNNRESGSNVTPASSCGNKRPVLTPSKKEVHPSGWSSPSTAQHSTLLSRAKGSHTRTMQPVKIEVEDDFFRRPSTSDVGSLKNKMLNTHLNEHDLTAGTTYAGMSKHSFREPGLLCMLNRDTINTSSKLRSPSRSSSCSNSNGGANASKKLSNTDNRGDGAESAHQPSSPSSSPALLLASHGTPFSTPKVGTRSIKSQVSRTPQCTPRGTESVCRRSGTTPRCAGSVVQTPTRRTSETSTDVPTLIFCPIEKMRQNKREDRSSLSEIPSHCKLGPTRGTSYSVSSPDALRSLKGILKNTRKQIGSESEKNMSLKKRVSPIPRSSAPRKVHFDEASIAQARRDRRAFKTQRDVVSEQREGELSGSEAEDGGVPTVLHDDELGLSWDHLDMEKLLADEDENEESRHLLGHTVRFSKKSSKKGAREANVGDWGQDSDWFNEQFGVVKSTPREEEHTKEETDVGEVTTHLSRSGSLRPIEPTTQSSSTGNAALRDHTRSKLVPLPPPMAVDQLELPVEGAHRPHNRRNSLVEGGVEEQQRSGSIATVSSCSTPPSSTHFSTAALSDVERGMLRALVRANWRNGRVPQLSMRKTDNMMPSKELSEWVGNGNSAAYAGGGTGDRSISSSSPLCTLPSPTAPVSPPPSQRRRSISWDVTFSNDTDPAVVDCEEIFPRKEVPKPTR